VNALDIAVYLIVLAALAGAAWTARRLYRTLAGDDCRTRNDRRQAWLTVCDGPRPEPPQPGTDISLYLACVATYGDCDELDRLRDAINQHRTGDTNG